MKDRRVVAIVQARMSSTRLPGKVLADLAGRPALALLVTRLSRAERLDEIVVATSTDPSDDVIDEWCRSSSVRCIRGSLKDVLGRYVQAAEATQADAVVRITADCPLIDPVLVDGLVSFFAESELDYCGLSGEFPHGLDCEVFTREALLTTDMNAIEDYDREHVTPFMKRHPGEFRTSTFAPLSGHAHERWTLDYPEDLNLLREIARRLLQPQTATTIDVLSVLDANPELRKLNSNRVQNR